MGAAADLEIAYSMLFLLLLCVVSQSMRWRDDDITHHHHVGQTSPTPHKDTRDVIQSEAETLIYKMDGAEAKLKLPLGLADHRQIE